MERSKILCEKCSKEISISNFNRHYKSCSGPIENLELLKTDSGKHRCKLCNKEFSKKGLGTHIWRNHGEGKEHNPNKERVAWNKGLNKLTDERVAKIANNYSLNIKNGKTIPSFKGKKHSDESIKKMSEKRIKLLEQRPELHPNRLLAGNKKKCSYPEKLAFEFFESNNIPFKHQENILKYWVDFLINDKLIIEIDGEYWHDKEKDKLRDKDLIDLGYEVIRVPAKTVLNDLKKIFLDL